MDSAGASLWAEATFDRSGVFIELEELRAGIPGTQSIQIKFGLDETFGMLMQVRSENKIEFSISYTYGFYGKWTIHETAIFRLMMGMHH